MSERVCVGLDLRKAIDDAKGRFRFREKEYIEDFIAGVVGAMKWGHAGALLDRSWDLHVMRSGYGLVSSVVFEVEGSPPPLRIYASTENGECRCIVVNDSRLSAGTDKHEVMSALIINLAEWRGIMTGEQHWEVA